MLSYKDMTFCADATKCANIGPCFRNFTELDEQRVKKLDIPVAFGSFKMTCKFWEEKK